MLILVSLVIANLSSFAQNWGDSTLKNESVFTSVEQPPKFKGGIKGFYQYLADNLSLPMNEFSFFSNKIVTVRAIINKEGKIAYAEIEKGLNEAYNRAAIDVVIKMPVWSPAKQNARPVFYYQLIPILFLNNN